MASKETEKTTKPDYAELHDIPRVTIEEAKQQILLSLRSKQRRGTIVLVGESGIGKTQIFDQISSQENTRVYPIYTAHFGLMGAGIPVTRDVDEGFFKIAVPDGFPKKDERAIVLFDEVNKGLRHSIDMFFTMMEAGRLFNYELPDNSIVCATMNPDTANYVVTTIDSDTAFRRRVKFLYVIPDFKGFQKHADTLAFHDSDRACFSDGKQRPCHPSILSYFRAKPNDIYDGASKDKHQQFTCPATIQTISLDAYIMEASKIGLTSDTAHTRFAASIGMNMATALINHIKDTATTIGAEDVLLRYPTVKNAVTRLAKKGMNDTLSELNLNVLRSLFATTPDPAIVSKNLLPYLLVQPKELAMAVLQQLNKFAIESKAQNYLTALMHEMHDKDEWVTLLEGVDDAHMEMDNLLKA